MFVSYIIFIIDEQFGGVSHRGIIRAQIVMYSARCIARAMIDGQYNENIYFCLPNFL